ncbi:dipeptidase [Paenibacillus turpanensis]|uniref:dipeptidase n=1 Tax=Paenibacillus turpanensis TaxID=2689078 RepID=UPI00140B8464|nr:dipeptidase [Paenibacillus turpanensis]
MRWIDLHCDVLSKLMNEPRLSFDREGQLDVTLPGLRKGGVKLQTFAIYISQELGEPNFSHILKEVDLYHSHILSHPQMTPIVTREDLEQLFTSNARIGAMLTLEGADGLDADLMCLRTLYRLGVRAVGITWNSANWAADGIMEPRGGGFTRKGRELVRECNRLGMVLDVSHLSENGFWELLQISSKPIIASHSNAYSLCPHPRNLKDEQIKAIIRTGGRMGITFVPWFVKAKGKVRAVDVLEHIDHVCSLGGEKQIGIGSDWDGIDVWIEGLERSESLAEFYELLQQHYSEELVERIVWRNMYEFLSDQLPIGQQG